MHRVVNGLLDPIEALAAVPPGRIASMQMMIAEHGHCLHYDRDDNTTHAVRQMPNALDITLHGSWLHTRGIRRNFSRADLCTHDSVVIRHRATEDRLRSRVFEKVRTSSKRRRDSEVALLGVSNAPKMTF